MENQGWIKLYRSLQNKSWYSEPDYVSLWVHLLLNASFADREYFWGGKTIALNPGQFVTGRKKLALETGIQESKIERILKCFENEQQIEQQTNKQSRLITIKNWNSFQQIEQQPEQRMNNERTTSEQRVNTNIRMKERKELKNDKNISTNVDSSAKFGNENINKILQAIKLKVRCGDFKESKAMQRIWGNNLYNLMEKLSPIEFSRRLDIILSDSFKQKNAGSLAFLHREIKGFVETSNTNNTAFIS